MYPIVSGNTLSVHGDSEVNIPAASTVAYVVAPTLPPPRTSPPMDASNAFVVSYRKRFNASNASVAARVVVVVALRDERWRLCAVERDGVSARVGLGANALVDDASMTGGRAGRVVM